MITLTIELDELASRWLDRKRGILSPEAFVREALDAYMALDEKGPIVRQSRLQDALSDRLDELQSRIRRLNDSLTEYRPA